MQNSSPQFTAAVQLAPDVPDCHTSAHNTRSNPTELFGAHDPYLEYKQNTPQWRRWGTGKVILRLEGHTLCLGTHQPKLHHHQVDNRPGQTQVAAMIDGK